MKRDELKVGDKLRDNDPRVGWNRVLEVVEVYPNGVAAKDSIGRVRIYLRHRIFTDGKTRNYGLNRIKESV